MKVTRGVSLQQLEQILTNYAELPVEQSEVENLVSTLEGKANSPIAQSDVTGLVSALASKVSNSDFQAFLDVLDAQPSVINAISYKATTIPTGTATNGELCLCDDGKIYEYTGGAWDAGEALAIGERYWHFLTGSDVSGDSGSHTPGPYFYIYEWNGEEYTTYPVTFGTFACVENMAKFFWYNGSQVVEFSSSQITAGELLAIQNANLQGTDTVAKTSDIPAPQLSSDELTAIQNASLVNTDTIAKVSDIPAPQLSSGELTAIQNASLVNTDTVAKTSDIPSLTGYVKSDGSVNFTGEEKFEKGIYCGNDAIDTYTKTLLHFDGIEGGTTITDAIAGHIWTAHNNAKLSTTHKKWGTAGLLLGSLATDDKVESTSADYVIGTNEFTIDFWLRRHTKAGSFRPVFSLVGTLWSFLMYNTDGVYYRISVDGKTIQISDSYGINTWFHVAIVGNGSSIKLYMNGILQGSVAYVYNYPASTIRIGSRYENYDNWYGAIDEFRLSIGIQRWTESFSVPTSAYGLYKEGTIRLQDLSSSNVSTINYTKWNSLETTNGIVKCDGSGSFSAAIAGELPYDDTSETMPEITAKTAIIWKNDGKYYLCFSPDGVVKIAVQLGIV